MGEGEPHRVTDLLVAWSQADEGALQALTPMVYDELRRLARSYMRQERAGHTLQSTAVALSPSNGLITPSAPGPITRVRLEPKILRIWPAASGEYASCVPSRGESRTTPFTLCWTQSATTAGVASAEVTATARSTLPGTSLSLV